jgi:acyl carrier protein
MNSQVCHARFTKPIKLMNIREIILKHLAQTMGAYSPIPVPACFNDTDLLDDLWLDSIGIVTLFSAIETEVGHTPLNLLESIGYPKTIGELVALYENGVRL